VGRRDKEDLKTLALKAAVVLEADRERRVGREMSSPELDVPLR
jgi:hypothetical protein